MITTTVMGSYPQPRWLVHEERLLGDGVARVRNEGLWKVSADDFDEAIEAATLVAIADQQHAGVDIITDGEVGRESYFNHFACSLGGVSRTEIGVGVNRRGGQADVPLVEGEIHREFPIELAAAKFLVANATHRTKVTVPGPFTLSQLADNRHYADQRALALAYAAVVNEELRDLAAAGVDLLQLDEPYLQANSSAAAEIALEALGVATAGVTAETCLHTCYGYAAYVKDKSDGYPFLDPLAEAPVDWVAIESAQPDLPGSTVARLAPRKVVLGVIDLGRETVETSDEVAARIRRALEHIAPENLAVSPDCGMKYLPRERAQAKLAAMCAGAAIVRSELG
ncbi:MAG: cobalamin-independent methionine synthase II family protein [Actinomycetota bacterium]|nr:cobalamin-independent methionine synthase II family protein [Actinomycetota bacterium]